MAKSSHFLISLGEKLYLKTGVLWIAEPINRPGISDSGLYSCKVKHKSTWVQSRIASVTVAVLGPFSVQPLSTSIMVGESHRFICKIPNAIPTPVTTWFKNNILLGNNSFVSAEILSRRFSSVIILPNGELEVKNASEMDMGNYHCSVSNIAKSRRSSKAMLIILPNTTQEQSLPKLLRRPVNTSTVVGMSVYFDCFADGFPNPKITWLKGGKNLNF
uniref:Ig-like domain-containing protein n=1 Tax=Ciona savignyi TaxID=51511 RepID=H2ZPZ8_CIOSA